MELKWLDRTTVVTPYLALCTTKDMYREACAHLKVEWPEEWIRSNAGASCHTFESDEKKLTCVVCIDIEEAIKLDSVVVVGMLAHEATHVYQRMIEVIGERTPSSEFQAYSIQNILQELLWDYQRQRDERTKEKAHA